MLNLKIFIVKKGSSQDFSKPMLMLSCLPQFGHVKICITLGTHSQEFEIMELLPYNCKMKIGACLKHLDTRLTCALVFVSTMKISQSISRCETTKCGNSRSLYLATYTKGHVQEPRMSRILNRGNETF